MSIAAASVGRESMSPRLARIEGVLGLAAEIPAILALLAEVLILFVSVLFRYVLHHPLSWSNELATNVFLWLAMLGAAVAARRGEHMRLTTIAMRLHRSVRGPAAALAEAGPCLFLLLVLLPSASYVGYQTVVTTPALGLPDAIRCAAVPVGIALMLGFSLLRLARLAPRDIAISVAVMAALALVLALASPLLEDMGRANLLVFFVALLGVAILFGMPIASAFGLSTVAYLLCTSATPLVIVAERIDEGTGSLILLAIPLFVLLGQLLELTGMARALVEFLASLLGTVRGGLNYVLLGGMLLVSGISGAKTADMAAIAPVLFPEMRRRGIPDGEMVSLLAASGAMAETIPPSLVLIAIGSVTGLSISALFTAGLLPGLVLAVALAILSRARSAREPGARRVEPRVVLKRFGVALPALVLPFLVRTAVVRGVATPTEVSVLGVAYTVLAGLLIYRRFDWRRLYPMLVEAASLSGAILFVIGTATAMGWALTQSGFSQSLAAGLGSMPGGRYGFLLASIVMFIVLGAVLEGIPAMVLFGPLLFPIAKSLGVHQVHYAIVVILAMGIGLFAPPFGLGYYAACTIGRIDPDAGIRRIWPYLGVLAAALLLVAFIPWLSVGFLAR